MTLCFILVALSIYLVLPPLLKIQINCCFIGDPSGYWTNGHATLCKHDVDNAASTSSADCNPAMLVTFHLILHKDMTSAQHVFRVGAADTVFCQVLFIMFVPVELSGFPHHSSVYINCTYTSMTVPDLIC